MALINKDNIRNIIKSDNISNWFRKGFKDKRDNVSSDLDYLDRVSVDDFRGMMPDSPNKGKDYIVIGDRIYDEGLPSEVIAIRKGNTRWIIIEYATFSTKEIRNRISDYLKY